MTMAPHRKSSLSPAVHVTAVTAEWLRNREYIHPGTSRFIAKSTYAHTSGIYRRVLPQKWQLLQEQLAMMATESRPDKHQKLRAGFLALQATVQAREAMVYDAGLHKKDAVTANNLTWTALTAYCRTVAEGRTSLPSAAKLVVPLDEAVQRYTGHEYGSPVHTFIGMVGLSATLIADYPDRVSGQLLVPNPGASLDALHAWDYDPSSLSVPLGSRF